MSAPPFASFTVDPGYGGLGIPDVGIPPVGPTPTVGPTTTGGGGVGGAPNYKDLIDSLLAPIRQQFAGESLADARSRAAAIQRAYAQFGENPDFDFAAFQLGLDPAYAGDITPEARALAQQNTTAGFSTVARLKQAREDAIRTVKNTLAARGILRSGETGFQLGRTEQAASRAQYDARQQLLDYFAGAQQAFLQAERERQRSLSQYGLGLFDQIPLGRTDGGGANQDQNTDTKTSTTSTTSTTRTVPTNPGPRVTSRLPQFGGLRGPNAPPQLRVVPKAAPLSGRLKKQLAGERR